MTERVGVVHQQRIVAGRIHDGGADGQGLLRSGWNRIRVSAQRRRSLVEVSRAQPHDLGLRIEARAIDQLHHVLLVFGGLTRDGRRQRDAHEQGGQHGPKQA